MDQFTVMGLQKDRQNHREFPAVKGTLGMEVHKIDHGPGTIIIRDFKTRCPSVHDGGWKRNRRDPFIAHILMDAIRN